MEDQHEDERSVPRSILAGRRRPRQSSNEADSGGGAGDDGHLDSGGGSGTAPSRRHREVVGLQRAVPAENNRPPLQAGGGGVGGGPLREQVLREHIPLAQQQPQREQQQAPIEAGDRGQILPPGTPEGVQGLEGLAPLPPPPILAGWLPVVEEGEQGETNSGAPSPVEGNPGVSEPGNGERDGGLLLLDRQIESGSGPPAAGLGHSREFGENVLVEEVSGSRPARIPGLARGGLSTAIGSGGRGSPIKQPHSGGNANNDAAAQQPQRPHAAAGHREKRDPRPLSSGDKSRLSNDPPKRQRKGPGFMVGSAPRDHFFEPFATSPIGGGGGDGGGDTSPVGNPLFPISPAVPAAHADSQGSVGGGRPINSNLLARKQLEDEANSSSSDGGGTDDDKEKVKVKRAIYKEESPKGRKKVAHGKDLEEDEKEGEGELEELEGELQDGGSASESPAAWGSSLVCADLTLHEVASQYWPAFKAAGARQSGGMSLEEEIQLERLTVALGSAITGAVKGARSPSNRKMNPKVKSLAAASAFDELLKEQEELQRGKGSREVDFAEEGSDTAAERQ